MTTFIIFAVLIILIMSGVPVAVSLGMTSIAAFIALGESGILYMLAQRMYASVAVSPTLLAIPFFILAGNLMNTGGITNRIFRFACALVGHVHGGLGQVNVIASMIFSGMSGAAVADAAGLGQMEIKAMDEQGYDRPFSAAITAASSTIGPVIPPSIPFVIYAHLTSESVGRLFLAGFLPGILMGIALMIAVYIISRIRKYPKNRWAGFKEIFVSGADAILPLGTIIIIIGGILGGVFTPTEASVIASLYALILGMVIYREVKPKDLPKIIWETIIHTIRVLFIIAAAGFFQYLMIHQRIPQQMIAWLATISMNRYIILGIIILVLLVLGCFLEGIAVLLITIPIFLPVITKLGIDPIQFGVIMTLASMIGLLTPPVGMCLYAVSSISNVKIGVLTRELWPYMVGIFLVLLLIMFFPSLSLWLPNAIMGVR